MGRMGKTEQRNSREKGIYFFWEFLWEMEQWNKIKEKKILCPPCFLKGKIHFSCCTSFNTRALFPFGNRAQFPVKNHS